MGATWPDRLRWWWFRCRKGVTCSVCLRGIYRCEASICLRPIYGWSVRPHARGGTDHVALGWLHCAWWTLPASMRLRGWLRFRAIH